MNKRKSLGFTLIELIAVLIILGLIASIVAPNVMKRVGGARAKTARVQVEELGAALDLFFLELGRYPSSDEGLQALVEQPSDAPQWNGPYLKKTKVPEDPWGNSYRYESPGKHGDYDLASLGADNAEGGEDDNADVASWE
ncbi:MAG: type II secretion system major pseudopilin GspG [Gammaproteobacteria bacterium]